MLTIEEFFKLEPGMTLIYKYMETSTYSIRYRINGINKSIPYKLNLTNEYGYSFEKSGSDISTLCKDFYLDIPPEPIERYLASYKEGVNMEEVSEENLID